ncbi:MAG: RAMP superfamily CRISPR-associated protein [Bacteroidota bacterium]
MKYTHRYLARVILKAETALFVGSGETSLIKDALVQKDYLGFPMIPGTSLTGVLRHALTDHGKEELWKDFFGFQKKKSGKGSQVKISAAYFLLPNNQVPEDLSAQTIPALQYFTDLPSRQHVRISDKGVAVDQGLFENEVVYQGCRFIFEMELKGDGNVIEKTQWQALLNQLKNPLFRIGQGTRNGYGQLSVESCKTSVFDLANKEKTDFQDYLNFDPSFNASDTCLLEEKELSFDTTGLLHYQLALTPDSFFIFSSGYGDEEVDNQPIMEDVLIYTGDTISLEKRTLIPASSIKGAISHRTCFHYNKEQKIHADEISSIKSVIGSNNEAVYQLFGAAAGTEDRDGQKGKVIINDLYYQDIDNSKILNHVAIDRFTGGALDGALFSEKVSHKKDPIILDIWIESIQLTASFQTALEKALMDICKGLLPLGGMTTKGHGMFTGSLTLNGTKKYNYASSL